MGIITLLLVVLAPVVLLSLPAPVHHAAATPVVAVEDNQKQIETLLISCDLTSFLPMASATSSEMYTNILNTIDSSNSTTTDGYLKWLTSATGIGSGAEGASSSSSASKNNETKYYYHGKIYLPTRADSCYGMAFHWGVDKERSTIRIAVAVKAQGWAAFGTSLTGGMVGSDIVYFESSSTTSTASSTNIIEGTFVMEPSSSNETSTTSSSSSFGSIHDAHVLDYNGRPMLDDGAERQDWTLMGSQKTHDGYLIFEAERALDTGDSQDLPIVDDSIPFVSHHKIIGAWGDSPTIFYHGNNRVQSSIQFFPNNEQVTGTPPGTGQEERSDNVYNVFLSEMNRRSEGYVDLILDSYNVLLQRTRYENVCFSQANLTDFGLPLVTEDGINSKLYLVGYEFLIPTMCTKYLHHIVVYGMTAAFNTNPNKCSFISSNPAFGWTPGEDFAYFPDNSGIALGGTSGFNAFISQYHFDNKDMDAGVSCDGSGVRMYFTTQPQEHEIGTVQIGDPLVGLKGMKIGKGFTEHTFDCPSTCSDYMFSGAPGGKVTVIGETLHMHSLGKKIVNQVVRNGRVIHEAKSDFWDFAQTGLKAVQQRPYTLQTGDQFLTTCFYKASDTDVFGFGSHEEMCMAFLFYFPRQDSILASTCGTNPDLKYYIPKCFASHNSKALDSVDDLGRTFGSLLPLGGTGGTTGPVTPTQTPVIDEETPTAASSYDGGRIMWCIINAVSILVIFLLLL